MNSSRARVIHERPDLIQQLDWQPEPCSVTSQDPVQTMLFSFCNGELDAKKKQQAGDELALEKARTVNKPNFRP